MGRLSRWSITPKISLVNLMERVRLGLRYSTGVVENSDVLANLSELPPRNSHGIPRPHGNTGMLFMLHVKKPGRGALHQQGRRWKSANTVDPSRCMAIKLDR
ncbi:hypothetical protein Ae201684P_005488 [Aphanomyces euteiches]|nr:hypothetical protein Ae201684P_005488 [Aphanomyces euteiches]